MMRRGLDRSPIGSGQRIHRVTVQTPTPPTADGDGGYTQGWTDATPPSWIVELRAASLRDLERFAAGTTLTTAAWLVTGPYRPDVTVAARLLHAGRVLSLVRVTNVDERARELVCIAVEVVSLAPAGATLGLPTTTPPPAPLASPVPQTTWSNE